MEAVIFLSIIIALFSILVSCFAIRRVKKQIAEITDALIDGNQNDYPENALVPYPVILAASKGDPDAMKMVLQHFSGYIASLSMRKLYDERGNVYYGVDEDIRERLQARLMRAILTFRAE